MTLAAMYTVPLACVILVWAMGAKPMLLTEKPGRLRIERSARTVGVIVMVVLIGSGSAYYALFTVALVVILGGLAAVSQSSVRHVASAVLVAGGIVVVLALNSMPSLLYQRSHGNNPMAMYRSAAQLDALSLRPVQMVSPVPGHRFGLADSLGREIAAASPGGESMQYLGVFGALGFAAIVVSLASRAARSPGHRSEQESIVDARLGGIVIVTVLCGVTGGLALLPAVRGLDQLRAWGRVSVFIAFVSLFAVGQVLEHVSRSWNRRVVPIIAVAIVAVGVWDQVPDSIVADPRANRDAFFADRAFVSGIEAVLPAGSMIFQLPQATYPEEPVINTLPIDNLIRPYLHSRSLRWSFGGIRGTQVDWMEATSRQELSEFLDSISAVGFAGIVIDRLGYADNGAQLVEDLGTELGLEPNTSAGGRHVFFDLRPYAKEVVTSLGSDGVAARARAELERPYLWWADGFDFPIRRSDGDRVFQGRTRSEGTIVRSGDEPVTIRLSFLADSLVGPATLRVDAGGVSTEIAVGRGATTGELTIPLDGTRTPISWRLVDTSQAIPAGQLAIVVSDVRVDVVR